VKLCYNYFQSNPTDVVPMFRGIPLTADKNAKLEIHNYDLRKERKDLLESNTNHINIDKNVKLHEVLVNHVLEVCLPRATWLAMHNHLAAPATQPIVGARTAPAVHSAADLRGVN
jgi:hypothetical protein